MEGISRERTKGQIPLPGVRDVLKTSTAIAGCPCARKRFNLQPDWTAKPTFHGSIVEGAKAAKPMRLQFCDPT